MGYRSDQVRAMTMMEVVLGIQNTGKLDEDHGGETAMSLDERGQAKDNDQVRGHL
jgi:hypothetical protein